jgi:hypothetical protein
MSSAGENMNNGREKGKEKSRKMETLGDNGI